MSEKIGSQENLHPDTVCWGQGEQILWEEYQKKIKEEKEDAESD